MANTVNFKNMSDASYKLAYAFAVSRYLEAAEDIRHKAVLKKLKNKRAVIIEDREDKLVSGYSVNDAISATSIVEVENAMRAEDLKHDGIMKPLKTAMKESYSIIPDGLFEAYKLKFDGKNKEFVDMIDKFLVGIGIVCPKKGVVRKTADRIALMMGSRLATSKMIVNEGVYISTMKKQQFNKLFMSGFVDTLINVAGFKFEIPNKDNGIESK